MSGRDTFRTGMQYEEIQNQNPWGLPLDEATIADRFKAAGYSTHMVSEVQSSRRRSLLLNINETDTRIISPADASLSAYTPE